MTYEVKVLNSNCPSCTLPIQRNSALFEGELWHWGCLKNTERFGEAVAQCHACFSYLSSKMIIKTEYGLGKLERSCGSCGSQNLRNLGKHPQEWEIVE